MYTSGNGGSPRPDRVEHHRLEMMHRHRRHGPGFPRAGGDVEDLYRLRRLAGADEIEAFADFDVSGFESRDVLSHNLENVLAATACAGALGVPSDRLRVAIRDFRAVAHRLQWVRDRAGVIGLVRARASPWGRSGSRR